MLPRVSTNVSKKTNKFKGWLVKDHLFHKNPVKVLSMNKMPNVEDSDMSGIISS